MASTAAAASSRRTPPWSSTWSCSKSSKSGGDHLGDEGEHFGFHEPARQLVERVGALGAGDAARIGRLARVDPDRLVVVPGGDRERALVLVHRRARARED